MSTTFFRSIRSSKNIYWLHAEELQPGVSWLWLVRSTPCPLKYSIAASLLSREAALPEDEARRRQAELLHRAERLRDERTRRPGCCLGAAQGTLSVLVADRLQRSWLP